jgi:hypothetical protein
MGDGVGAHHSLEFSRQETWGLSPQKSWACHEKYGGVHFFIGNFQEIPLLVRFDDDAS